MKKLNPYSFNDIAALDALELSSADLGIVLKLGAKICVLDQYEKYDSYVAAPQGKTSKFRHLAVLSQLMINAYSSAPNAIKDLKEGVQDKHSPNICPMCGSLKTGTADHYLPKDDFPEFSFFSKNLVPACDCNIKRGSTLIGTKNGERIIHPYYETLLSQRIITANFDFSPAKTSITIGKLYPAGLARETIDFHVKNIHQKTTMCDWLIAEWARLIEDPLNSMSWYPRKKVTDKQVVRRLNELMKASDAKLGTPNNWPSALFHGVISSPVAISRMVTSVNAVIV